MNEKTVVVIGASNNRAKFGNKAVRAFRDLGYHVCPVNPTCNDIEGLPCFKGIQDVPGPIGRVLMYVPPSVGLTMIEEIAAKTPDELWLNPGTESDALIQKAQALGLNVIVGCCLIAQGVAPAAYG